MMRPDRVTFNDIGTTPHVSSAGEPMPTHHAVGRSTRHEPMVCYHEAGSLNSGWFFGMRELRDVIRAARTVKGQVITTTDRNHQRPCDVNVRGGRVWFHRVLKSGMHENFAINDRLFGDLTSLSGIFMRYVEALKPTPTPLPPTCWELTAPRS
jgi:hypothetical protein